MSPWVFADPVATASMTEILRDLLSGELGPFARFLGDFGLAILILVLILTGRLVPLRSVRERETLWQARLEELEQVISLWREAYARLEATNEQHAKALEEIVKGIDMSAQTIQALRELGEGEGE